MAKTINQYKTVLEECFTEDVIRHGIIPFRGGSNSPLHHFLETKNAEAIKALCDSGFTINCAIEQMKEKLFSDFKESGELDEGFLSVLLECGLNPDISKVSQARFQMRNV